MIMVVDYSTLTDEELAAEEVALTAEFQRRQDLALIPSQIDELNKKMLNAGGVKLGDPWNQPQGAHDAYPLGWIVGHGEKTWESLIHGNVWEPGVSGWRELTLVDTTAEWIRPTGAHDSYSIGDEVLFQTMVYRSLIDANAWSPVDFPQGWELVSGETPVEPTP